MKQRAILKNKTYLYLTEFFSGMSVMAVELGASRLLAPYFSSSQIVWTIIIGTIMIAMALGNIYGGRSADKNPDPDRLYTRILIAALWIGLIPVAGKYIIIGITGVMIFAIDTNLLIAAAFAACMVIFVFPLFLLGTVTPSLAKYTMDSLGDSGKVVGMLNAANTIGSIIGTFVPTFVTIPAVGTAVTFLIFAGILLALAAAYFLSAGIGKGKTIVSCVILALCCVFGSGSSFAFWETDLTVEDESIYNYLRVYEDDRAVALSTNVLFGVQSVYQKDGGLTGMYYDYAMAAPYMAGVREAGRPLDVLILGMGTGTYATQCSRYFGEMNVEGVEIDEKITALARDYFQLPDSVPVVTYDGRAYLQALESDRLYDVILVDAFQDITIPFQMASREFFTLVHDHLRDSGVMVVNMNMRGQTEDSINDWLSDTIASVFPVVCTADVRGSTNRELFAGRGDLIGTFDENLLEETNVAMVDLMARVREGLTVYEAGGRVMTDDRAPVELLSMRAMDELISDEVSYYKGQVQGMSIGEILDMLQ